MGVGFQDGLLLLLACVISQEPVWKSGSNALLCTWYYHFSDCRHAVHFALDYYAQITSLYCNLGI